jgi:hypothetical protein
MSLVTRNKTRRRRNGGARQKPAQDGVVRYASDAWSLAKRTAYGLNEIRKLINIETKFCDTQVTSTSMSTTWTLVPISELAQGLTSATRVGDSIKLQHIEVRGRIFENALATNSVARVIVFRDLDGDGTSPTGGELMETSGGAMAPLSPYRYNRKQRFSILFDETFSLQSILATGISSQVFSFSTSHEGHVLYLGTTAAAASDGKGTVYVAYCSDEASTNPTIAFYSRIMFTDD